MLDHSVVSAAAESSSRGRAVRRTGEQGARQADGNNTSFGDVFSEALADRRPTKADRRDDAARSNRPDARKTSDSKRAARAKDANRPADSTRPKPDDTPVEDRQSDTQPTDDSVDAAATQDLPTEEKSDTSDKPKSSDKSDSSDRKHSADTAGDAAQQAHLQQPVDPIPVVNPAQQVVAEQVAVEADDALAGQTDAAPSADTPKTNQPKHAAAVDTAMQPLQWLARQHADRLGTQTKGASQAPAQPAALHAAATEPAKAVQGDQAAQSTEPAQTNEQAGDKWAKQSPIANAFAKLMQAASAKHQATTADPPQSTPVVKAGADQAVRSLTADASTLLPPSEKAKPDAQAAASAPNAHTGDPAAAALRPDSTASTIQVADTRTIQAPSQPSAAQAAVAKDTALPFALNDPKTGENADHLAKIVYMAAGRGQSVARMHLTPPDLGEVTATLRLNQGHMQLSLQVASDAARDVVTSGLDRLRDNLQHQGISLHETSVTVAPRADSAAGREHQPNWQGQDAQQQQSDASQQQGGNHSQAHHGQSSPAEFAFDAGPVGAAEEQAAPMMSYTVSLNVVA